eukprot:jgi/Picsp_1/6447/NSC_03794-R1_glucan endo- -beta-d-glucosidase
MYHNLQTLFFSGFVSLAWCFDHLDPTHPKASKDYKRLLLQDKHDASWIGCKQEGWSVAWEDTFDGSIDDNWSYQMYDAWQYGFASWGNEEQQFYTRESVRVENGTLKIDAAYEPNSESLWDLCWAECYARCDKVGKGIGHVDHEYCMQGCGVPRCQGVKNRGISSGRVYTKNAAFVPSAATGGNEIRVEARMKLPVGLGLWPAFWMLPVGPDGDSAPGTGVYGEWPASGEIDVFESVNDMSTLSGTIHYGAPYPNGTFSAVAVAMPKPKDVDGYRVFGVEWSLGQIRWYVDGEYYGDRRVGSLGPTRLSSDEWYTTAPWGGSNAPFDQPFYILINLAVGGVFPDAEHGAPIPLSELQGILQQSPKTLQVDWVRHFDDCTSM